MATKMANGSTQASEDPHQLEMNAVGYFYLPAASLGDEGIYHKYRDTIVKCQIFMIGLRPVVKLVNVVQTGKKMSTVYHVLGQDHAPEWPIPPGWELEQEKGAWTLVDAAGKRMFPDTEHALARLHEEFVKLDFNALYIGQVFGGPGARNAVEQLRKSEIVKKINATGVPDGYRLEVLLLEVAGRPASRVEADDAEKITLCEAALIRHFKPKFNQHPDGGFPSTKPRMLHGLADRTISSVVMHIALEELPFRIFSDAIAPESTHKIAQDLHDHGERERFFG